MPEQKFYLVIMEYDDYEAEHYLHPTLAGAIEHARAAAAQATAETGTTFAEDTYDALVPLSIEPNDGSSKPWFEVKVLPLAVDPPPVAEVQSA